MSHVRQVVQIPPMHGRWRDEDKKSSQLGCEGGEPFVLVVSQVTA